MNMSRKFLPGTGSWRAGAAGGSVTVGGLGLTQRLGPPPPLSYAERAPSPYRGGFR